MADHRNMPSLPRLDLAKMSMDDLDILFDYFDALSAAAMGIFNQPRCCGGVAGDFVEKHWSLYLLGMKDRIIAEVEGRTPSDKGEAEVRAQMLIGHLSESDDFEKMAAIAASVTTV